MSEATRHYERVLFLSGTVGVNMIKRLMLLCVCVCLLTPCIIRNLFGQFWWLSLGFEVEGQAKRLTIKENFTNECGGKIEFEFVVFED